VIIVGTPHSRGSGYFVNDQNLKSRQEADVRTCPHCQALIKMQEWAKAPVQNFCLKCMAPACNNAACQDCVPFVKKIEAYMRTQLLLKAARG
jgi:hypothetical protein